MTDRKRAPEEGAVREGVATSPLRMWGYAAILTALAFSQSAGRMVADTKFDLLTDPVKFLLGGLRLWDPSAAFGQIQNQAYGYAWPMGPFFLLGKALQLPPWVIQRLWWSLLLCLAFFGIVKLAQKLGIGSPFTQVVAGFAFVLTPRITTLLGGTSVEAWPMALAPWVLIPLVVGSQRGSVRRAAAASALVVACCGGVNAVAVAAVLPLGVIWILTRAGGPRKWPLLGWWTFFTVLATLWWSAPLLFLGRYSVPFLDYIENATITTVPTDLARTFVGQSDWVAYFAGIDYPAGQQLVTTPFLMLDAAAIAAFGLIGIALRSNPQQRFLTWGVLTGVVLVGFGYADDLSGFLAATRVEWLDGPLAALRNLHKFDVVLRVPLVLGLACVLAELPTLARDRASTWAVRALQVAAVLAVVAMTLPWVQDRMAPREGVYEVPDYWYEVADYLEEHDDGTVALELPASTFGVYDWGNVHDDVMQGLAGSPWAVRNVIPLAQPGNVAFLDAVTRAVEGGRPSAQLASFLAANGVGKLVVRNDLDRFETGAPDPAYVRSVLTASPGITLAESFGPTVGSPPYAFTRGEHVRVVNGSGITAETGTVDVYTVDGAAAATVAPGPQVLVGDPGTGLDASMADLGPGPRVLAEDAGGEEQGEILTDGTKRRETNFAAVRFNQSATMPAGEPYRLRGPEHAHRFLEHPERWQTTESWSRDVVSVTASTSQAYADAQPPLQIGTHPGAALDDDPATQWQSARHLDPTSQWWQETFTRPTLVDTVTITLGRDSAPVPQLLIQAGDQSRLVPAPAPGKPRTYALHFSGADYLRITAAGRDLELPGTFAIAEVSVPDVEAQRYLSLPVADDRFPLDAIAVSRDPDRAACVLVGSNYACDDSLISPGEDGDTLARRFLPPYQSVYELAATASLRRTVDASLLLSSGISVTSDATVREVASGPVALADGDLGTTWVSRGDEQLHLQFPEARKLGAITLQVTQAAAAAMPSRLLVRADEKRAVVKIDEDGHGRLPRWRTDELDIQVRDTHRAYGTFGRQFVELPGGISELQLDGQSLNPGSTTQRRFPCGTGPQITVAGQLRDTSLRASTRDLIRGQRVPLRICGSADILLTQQASSLLALPTPLFRVDAATLQHDAAAMPAATPVAVRHDDAGAPSAVDLDARAKAGVLTLPQNINAGWEASLGGADLAPVRMDGWKQAWRVPAGEAGTVELSYRPAAPFTILLVAGAVGLLVVLAVLVWPRRRVPVRPAPLVAGRPGLVDLVVVLAAGALLAGWWGLAAVVAGTVAGLRLRRFDGWAWLAGLALLAGTLALTTERLTRQSWVVTWSQAWSIAAIALVVAALAGLRVRTPKLTNGRRTGPKAGRSSADAE